jgi:hypothetical protein
LRPFGNKIHCLRPLNDATYNESLVKGYFWLTLATLK